MFFLLEGVLVGGQIWFDLIPLGEFCSEGKKPKDNREYDDCHLGLIEQACIVYFHP